jgi:hypothetical protein
MNTVVWSSDTEAARMSGSFRSRARRGADSVTTSRRRPAVASERRI